MRVGQAAVIPDSVDGLLPGQASDGKKMDAQTEKLLREAGEKAEAMITQAPAPATPPPMPAAAVPMSPADPFAAAPVARKQLSMPKAVPAKNLADQAVGLVTGQVQEANANGRRTDQLGAIRTASVQEGYITTANVNQLRPTGRRSLQVEVPLVGETYHFRKLKDHAVLDLTLKPQRSSTKTFQQTMFGAGLGAWALMALIARRRRSAAL